MSYAMIEGVLFSVEWSVARPRLDLLKKYVIGLFVILPS